MTQSGAVSGTVALTAAGGAAPYTYIWNRISGSRITVSGGQGASFSATLGDNETLTETFRVVVVDSTGATAIASLDVRFTAPAAFRFTAAISGNTNNYNLRSAAVAAGWNQTSALDATVTVNSGVVVGSTSASAYAFDTGSGIPAGSKLKLVNNGKILGAGGKGGNGSTTCGCNYSPDNPAAGNAGGTAVRAQYAIAITNNGVIGGGGGGGGGVYRTLLGNVTPASGGGGGQGSVGGTGGAGGYTGNQFSPTGPAGGNGSPTAPGSPGGGGLGAAGATTTVPGGAGGACTSGNSNIT